MIIIKIIRIIGLQVNDANVCGLHIQVESTERQ